MFGMKCCWFCLRLDRHLARSMRKLKVGHCSRSTSLATPSASHEQWSPSVMTRWDFWHSRLMKVTFWDFEAFWIKRALGWRKIFLSIRSLWVLGGFWKYLFRIRSGVMPILTRWGFNGFHVCGAKSCFLMMGRGGSSDCTGNMLSNRMASINGEKVWSLANPSILDFFPSLFRLHLGDQDQSMISMHLGIFCRFFRITLKWEPGFLNVDRDARDLHFGICLIWIWSKFLGLLVG